MLQPKKTKFLKYQRGKIKGISSRGNRLNFGEYGLKSIDKTKYITSNQIEAARIAGTRYIKREGQFFINIFPDKPITKKPQEVRMGKGKGNIEYWVAVVKTGRILFEIKGVKKDIAINAFKLCASKLPIKTKFIFYNSILNIKI